MTAKLSPLFLAAVLLLAACGSDEDVSIDASTGDDTTDSTVAPSGDGDGADDGSGQNVDDVQPTTDGGVIIGRGNVGGSVVDPQAYEIVDIVIAESDPEQLNVGFTAGDPNCLAANAIAEVVGEEVIVTLYVGITTDALTKSCLADTFEHVVTVPLTEGLDGRSVVTAD